MSQTSQLLLALDEQRKNLAANLSQKGVAAQNTEGLQTLVPKVLDISGGGSVEPGASDIDMDFIIYSPSTQYNLSNIDFSLYDYMIVIHQTRGDKSFLHFKIPQEIGGTVEINPFVFYNNNYTRFQRLNNTTSPMIGSLISEDTMQFRVNSSLQYIFDIGSDKVVLYVHKKPTAEATMFKTRAKTTKYIMEDNVIPLIVNEDMTESEILVLFHVLEATKNNDNIYVLNNPLVTPELEEVVRNKGYNVIYR